jgi:hypothetical protein
MLAGNTAIPPTRYRTKTRRFMPEPRKVNGRDEREARALKVVDALKIVLR